MMKFNHAIILGGGFFGTLATYMLAHYFERVTLVEQDDLSQHTSRKGLPQATHLHVLIQQGQKLLEELMPGILSELCEKTLQRIDWAQDTKWVGPFGDYPQYPSDMKTLSFSRVWLDQAMARRLFDLANGTIIAGTVFSLEKNANRIDAVHVEDATKNKIVLRGDLIVDARGRRSNAGTLLDGLGYKILPPIVVNNELGYASRVYASSVKNTADFKQIYLQVRPGKMTKGVVVSPIENQRMIVSALGLGNDKPPRDEEGYRQYLACLPHVELQRYLATLEPVGSVSIFRNLKNIHHRFGAMQKWPNGFIVVGDAACVLNPVYGQGMTLAAKQIMLLKSEILRMQSQYKKSWEHAFQRKVDKLFAWPWLMTMLEDQRAMPVTALPLYSRVAHGYLDKILQLAVRNKKVHALFLSIVHMIRSPYRLLHPGLMTRVFFHCFLRKS